MKGIEFHFLGIDATLVMSVFVKKYETHIDNATN